MLRPYNCLNNYGIIHNKNGYDRSKLLDKVTYIIPHSPVLKGE